MRINVGTVGSINYSAASKVSCIRKITYLEDFSYRRIIDESRLSPGQGGTAEGVGSPEYREFLPRFSAHGCLIILMLIQSMWIFVTQSRHKRRAPSMARFTVSRVGRTRF